MGRGGDERSFCHEISVASSPFGGLRMRRPIFRDLPDELHLRLVAATTFPTGTMLHVYEPGGVGFASGLTRLAGMTSWLR